MNRYESLCFVSGIFTGLICGILIFAFTTTDNDNWRPKAVARGAAHWKTDGSFEWNTITNK